MVCQGHEFFMVVVRTTPVPTSMSNNARYKKHIERVFDKIRQAQSHFILELTKDILQGIVHRAFFD